VKITKGTVSGDVEYMQHADGLWSFRLTMDDDPVPIESDWNFASKELAEEQVNYVMESAALRIAEG
jgi:hypothetical protein